jgi:hypothetical protein
MRVYLPLALVCGVCLAAAGPVRAGIITTYTYASDSDLTPSLQTQYTYTQVIDLGQSGTVSINSVPFAQDSAANRVTYQYDVSPLPPGTNRTTSSSDNVSGSVRTLESHYIYDSNPGQATTITIRGLTVGYTYETDFYDIGSGSAGSQPITVRDGNLTVYTYDESYTGTGTGNGNVLRDVYTATATQYTYTFTPGSPTDTIYLYGFSNRFVAPEPSTLTLLGIGAASLLAYAWKRRRRAAV